MASNSCAHRYQCKKYFFIPISYSQHSFQAMETTLVNRICSILLTYNSYATLLQVLDKPGPEVIKLFSCSTQLSMKFFLLINVKMPTIVGILTFMSGKNSILGSSEPNISQISWSIYTYEHLKFHAQLSWVWKKLYNLGAWLIKLLVWITFQRRWKFVTVNYQISYSDVINWFLLI